MIALLDVNVLIALAWPSHLHHDAAHAWFAQNQQRGWATCPLTQIGFVRVSSTPAAVKTLVSVAEAFQVLEHSMRSPHHHFWAQTKPIGAMNAVLKSRTMGPKQLSDAVLVDLAIDQGGVLATFDKRIPDLFPTQSPQRRAVEILPV